MEHTPRQNHGHELADTSDSSAFSNYIEPTEASNQAALNARQRAAMDVFNPDALREGGLDEAAIQAARQAIIDKLAGN